MPHMGYSHRVDTLAVASYCTSEITPASFKFTCCSCSTAAVVDGNQQWMGANNKQGHSFVDECGITQE